MSSNFWNPRNGAVKALFIEALADVEKEENTMKKQILNAEDYEVIKDWDKQFVEYHEAVEKAKQFNLGDYLVLFAAFEGDPIKPYTNSYGAPLKFKVIFCTASGIPFIKAINKKGTPVGPIMTCLGTGANDDYSMYENFEFRLDPDYADALLLQDEYDPTQLHKSKHGAWKEITNHNKAAKVDTSTLLEIAKLFNEATVGNALWTSHHTHYSISGKRTLTRLEYRDFCRYNEISAYTKGQTITVLTVVDKKGNVKDITPDFFHYKALYKERPRTYKELNT